MDMLDRYLHAVKVFLPRTQQDDIVRELSENLIARMEDREAELGRPLDEGASSRELMQVAISVGTLFVVAFLARAGDLFLPRATAPLSEGVEITRVVDVVNASFQIGLAVTAAITVFEIWRGLRRLKRRRGTPLSSGSAHARAGH